MTDIRNTPLATGIEADEDARPTMIRVNDVSMVFNMASENLNNLKEYAIALAKHELRFKELRALDHVSFEVKKGDVFGIVGTNGSGKSTMLKIVAGVLEPSEGSVEINGQIAPLIELGAGFDMELTARENIYLNGALLGYSKKFIDGHFDEIVSFAEVADFLDMPMKNYSSGMVARIAFAIATVIVPEILIVDEVLSVGDFMFQRKCEDRIAELIEQHGVTVLIVSHSNDQIARLCNKVIWIEKGHTRLLGDADLVTRVYGGLAGRSGSAESEETIFDALLNMDEEPGIPFTTIKGESPSALSAHMTLQAWDSACTDTFVLSCDSAHINALMASAFSGALNAPLFSIKGTEIPEAVMSALLDKRPQRVLIVDCENRSEAARHTLSKLPWDCDVRRIGKGEHAFAYSCSLLELGTASTLWNRSALLVHTEANTESMVMLPYIAAKRCPVITAVSDMTDEADELCRQLSLADVDTLYIIGESISHRCDKKVAESGISVIRLPRHADVDRCLSLTEFVAHELEWAEHPEHEIMMATQSLSQWPELVNCGFYGAKKNAPLALVNEGSLDSIRGHLDLVKERADGLSVTFIGDRVGLSEVIRALYTSF